MPNRSTAGPVLVVEDHDDTRAMVEMFLEADGYRVQTAINGRDALDCVAHELPCLILLDLMMPVMDGSTFAEKLRADPQPAVAHTPIVLLTAANNARSVQTRIGALDVIVKPISFDSVSRIVEQHCGARER